ncbi:amidase [Alteromonas sp. a30]|uniref:amidase n=1 Tax=Alteromonas sp. a30 TaxID=2730917 RepID=UPI0022804245|nr:amidase [Alteromonas sp. a30]MCY7296288.1 amidase [Alteromonas sp. a30]
MTLRFKLASILSLSFMTLGQTQAMKDNEYHQLSIPEIHKEMASGNLTSAQLTQYYIDQIKTLNPILNAVITVNPNALTDAKAADKHREKAASLGILHGIPVLLKDNIDTADGMANTAGSLLLKDNFPEKDAFIVTQLRQAGAIILGKANLSEWANFRSTRSLSGWSAIGGQTKNPYDVTRTPCGSSSGSGAAVAAAMSAVAIGTETDGSITCPSAINGIVGIKPTVGSVSRTGIIPISSNHDTAGPMARSVTDAVYLLQAILGKDKEDRLGFESPYTENNLINHLKTDGLKGKRIGIVSNYLNPNPKVNEIFYQAVDTMKKAGAVIVDSTPIKTKGDWGQQQYNTLLWDFKDELADYLATTKSSAKTLADVMEFNLKHSLSEMPYFDQEIFDTANSSKGKQEPNYQSNLEEMLSLAREQGIDATLEKYNLDMLIAPTSGPAWKIDIVNGDHFQGSATSPAAVSGYPHITVPMGYVLHLPVGMSFFAGKNSEGSLVEAAYHFEQITKARRAPQLETR